MLKPTRNEMVAAVITVSGLAEIGVLVTLAMGFFWVSPNYLIGALICGDWMAYGFPFVWHTVSAGCGAGGTYLDWTSFSMDVFFYMAGGFVALLAIERRFLRAKSSIVRVFRSTALGFVLWGITVAGYTQLPPGNAVGFEVAFGLVASLMILFLARIVRVRDLSTGFLKFRSGAGRRVTGESFSRMGDACLLAGISSIVYGLVSAIIANSGLCSGILGGGCGYDYTQLILPSIVGGALLAIGSWLIYVFSTKGRDISIPSARRTNVPASLIRR